MVYLKINLKSIKKLIRLTSVLFALMLTSNLSAQELGLGFQASFPSYGLSLKADFNETHSGQVVLGSFGTVTTISGRYIYNFNETGDAFPLTPFVYGQIGQWSYDYDFLGIKESIFGYGVGAGLEFNWLSSISDNFKTTVEIGYAVVDLEYFDFSATMFGVGIHYYFLDF